MLGSWKLGSIRGISVQIHWTFWLVMIFYTLSAAASGGWQEGLTTAVFVAGVFACVVAHEFGHAFMAAAFGIPTHDITLLPIGGIARLARMPDRPLHELLIAVAGPAVNIVIAMLLFPALPLLALRTGEEQNWLALVGRLANDLIAANIFLVLFNMVPAFPMDGGRVLRSLIAMRTSHLRATEIAARVGRWLALVFVIAAVVYLQPVLLLIGIFVFVSGTAELFEARRRAMAQTGSFFQWGWSSSGPVDLSSEMPDRGAFDAEPNTAQPGRSQPTYSRPGRGEVIDAIDVREVKRGPYPGIEPR
jgi:stage IV sporulation protein FB